MKMRGRAPSSETPYRASLWDELAQAPILSETAPEPIVRGFFRTLFSTFYDRLGGLVLLNLAVSLQLLLGLAIGLAFGAVFRLSGAALLGLLVVFGWLALAPALGGLFSYARAICDPDRFSGIHTYIEGMRRYAVRSVVLLLVQVGSGGILALNLYFYSRLHSIPGLVLEFVVLFIVLLWAMAGLYCWPLLVRDLAWRPLFRNSLFLALAAPFSTVALLLSLSLIGVLLAATKVLWAVGLFSIWALTENVALQRLIRNFRARQGDEPDQLEASAQG